MSAPSLIDLAMACTPKQRAFANFIAEGLEGSEACRRAYGGTRRDKTCAAQAARTRKHPAVAAYIAALVARQERKKALSRDRKREHLSDIVEDKKGQRTADRIKAIEVDNVMTGENAPQQVQVFGLSELLAMVRRKS